MFMHTYGLQNQLKLLSFMGSGICMKQRSEDGEILRLVSKAHL